MNEVSPIEKDIVLLGGGHSHVEVLRAFGMNPISGIRLTLISRTDETPYSGMLPGHLAGHYTYAETHIDLVALCGFARAQFYRDEAIGLDPIKRQVKCKSHPPVAYDFLSIDIGSTPSMKAVYDAKKYAIPIKPIDHFLSTWRKIESSIRSSQSSKSSNSIRSIRSSRSLQSSKKNLTKIIIVGGGAGGVEVALSLQFRLCKMLSCQVKFSLITRSNTLLPNHNRRVSRLYTRIFEERGIMLKTGMAVFRVEKGRLHSGGSSFEFDHLLWVTDASSPKWIRESGLKVDSKGFILVNDFLQSSHPNVFAAGDIASMSESPRPKSGVYAVRQGAPLAANLRAVACGKALVAYRAQRHFLSLIGRGDAFAVASRGAWMAKGKWVWKWKDGIDRRFMRRYQSLQNEMSQPDISKRSSRKFSKESSKESSKSSLRRSSDESSKRSKRSFDENDHLPSFSVIRCAGCGAKIGPSILKRVLDRLPFQRDSKILIGLNSPDDAAVFQAPDDHMVQSIDHLPSFLNDPWLFARIAAIHCLSDILAMGANLHSAQITATIPYGLENPVEETLFQTLSGALDVLNDHHTPLIGGHTLEGARLELGMTINGTARKGDLFRKNALEEGDDLILTKPIGTGIILAAFMKGIALNTWFRQAIDTMLQSPISAIGILRNHHIRSLTDVTGFGLIGHLAEMLEGAKVNANLSVKTIPILEGAFECAERGIASSLYPQNRDRNGTKIEFKNLKSLCPSVISRILFDPQTAGGLLFGVKKKNTNSCLRELHKKGWHHAVKIGEITSRTFQDQTFQDQISQDYEDRLSQKDVSIISLND